MAGDWSQGRPPRRNSLRGPWRATAIVATSQPLAAQAGLEVLKRGGNAFDAAVATAAVLSVTEPMMVGPAGDMFAVLYVAKEHKLYAINASGKAPSGATVARMNGLGYAWNPANWGPGSGMPPGGILDVTVPGAVWGWDEVLHRFGTMTLKETLQPAIDYAEQGFPISERIASDWRLPKGLPPVPSNPSKCCTDLDPDAIATWYPGGRPSRRGQIFRNPGLARTYRILQAQGRDGFYKGEVAQAIVAKSSALGGTMTLDDLASYTGEWTTPVTTTITGIRRRCCRRPRRRGPPTRCSTSSRRACRSGRRGRRWRHSGREAPILALPRRSEEARLRRSFAYNADPSRVARARRRLLSKAHAQSLCGRVDPKRASGTRRRRLSTAAATPSFSPRPIATATWSPG